MKNPIIAEIHRYRAEHAKKFGYDLDRIFEDVRSRQGQSGEKLVDRSKKARAGRKRALA